MAKNGAVVRSVLSSRFTPEMVRIALQTRQAWHPFPRWDERQAWESLPEDRRAQAVARAERHLGTSWPELPATLFLEFRRNGNRSRYEARHHQRRSALAQLVLGECIEGKGRFLDDIVNGIWALCEESFWGVPAHNARHSPRFPGSGLPDTSFHEVDLFAAETAALLAWTHYLVGEQLGRELPVVLDRIEREVQERILGPYRRFDGWRWLGKDHRPVNNWNPWIHSNVLTANLLLEPDDETRVQTVLRVIEGLDAFLEGYHDDGGCDEGPGYWGRAGASLFDCLELLWSASNGALDAYDQPLIQNIGRYIYRVHIAGPWYVNFADASAKPSPDGSLIYRYGQRIGDARMMAHGAYVVGLEPEQDRAGASLGRALPALFAAAEVRRATATPPLVRHAWLGGIQVLTAREREGSAEGLFLAAKGGHNAESHNHNDVGSFIVALDGHPVLVDVGVETYTRKTFSAERYDIWTMQSLYHNLPAIDGRGQAPGRQYAARDVVARLDERVAELSLDIAPAYPAELGVERWRRTVRLERAGEQAAAHVVLEDEYELHRMPQRLTLHLMSSGPVDGSQPGRLICAAPSRPLVVEYDPNELAAHVETLAINDARLRPVWGEHLYRVVLEHRHPGSIGRWRLTMAAG